MKYETLHWRAFNIMARLFGLMALLAGSVFLCSAFITLDIGESVSNRDMTGDFLVGIFTFVIGIAFLKVAPYRPDLRVDKIDSPNASKSKLGWWTGSQRKY